MLPTPIMVRLACELLSHCHSKFSTIWMSSLLLCRSWTGMGDVGVDVTALARSSQVHHVFGGGYCQPRIIYGLQNFNALHLHTFPVPLGGFQVSSSCHQLTANILKPSEAFNRTPFSGIQCSKFNLGTCLELSSTLTSSREVRFMLVRLFAPLRETCFACLGMRGMCAGALGALASDGLHMCAKPVQNCKPEQ